MVLLVFFVFLICLIFEPVYIFVVFFYLFFLYHQFVVRFERNGSTVTDVPLQLKRRPGHGGFGTSVESRAG